MKDLFNETVKIGDTVAYVKRSNQQKDTSKAKGVVVKYTKSGVAVKTDNGNTINVRNVILVKRNNFTKLSEFIKNILKN